jgi:tRNA(Ile)-lysidine synthase
MSSSSPTLITKLMAAWPPEKWRDHTVLVAVSGGADSVALVRGLTKIRGGGEGRLIVAHFNHRLRGADSDADQAFVANLAAQLGLPVAAGAATTDLAAAGGQGIEEAARQVRYDFLGRAASETGARYVATAHTADDNIETVLFNVLRGTGLAGLAGIPRFRALTPAAAIVRPLLEVTRSEVLEYLQSPGQVHRNDATNRIQDFTRNRIRHQLLPLLERDYNPRVREAILRLAQIAGQADELLTVQARHYLDECAKKIAGGVEIDLASISNVQPVIVRQILLLAWQEEGWPLQDMSQARWDLLGAMTQPGIRPAPQMFPGGIRAERVADALRLSSG